MGHFGGPFFSHPMAPLTKFLAALALLSLTACAGHKVPIGIESSFALQGHHLWHQDIGDEFIQAYEGCCRRESLPIFLHRVIQDERGWVMLVGAGEGTSKGDIASVFGSALGDAIQTKHVTLNRWQWDLEEGIQVLRYAYDEPQSGLLITMDCVLPPYVSREEAEQAIEEDLKSCLSVR